MVIEPTEDSLKQHLLCGVWYCHTYQKVHSGRVDVMIDADSFVLIVQVYTRHGVIVAFLILSVHDKTFDRISEWSSMDKRCDGGGTVISVRSGPKKPGNGHKKPHHRVKISPLRKRVWELCEDAGSHCGRPHPPLGHNRARGRGRDGPLGKWQSEPGKASGRGWRSAWTACWSYNRQYRAGGASEGRA